MTNGERITDKDVALEVAYIVKPYIEIAQTAKSVGKQILADSIIELGKTRANYTQVFLEGEERHRQRQLASNALSDLYEQNDGLVLERYSFKTVPKELGDGLLVWDAINERADTDEGFPISRIEYYDGEFALVGDFNSALDLLSGRTEKNVFANCVQHMEDSRIGLVQSNIKYLHESPQS